MSTPSTPYSSSEVEAADKARGRVAPAIPSSALSLFAGSSGSASSSFVAPNSAVQESITPGRDAKAEAKQSKEEAKESKAAKSESKEAKAESKEDAKAEAKQSKEDAKENKESKEAKSEHEAVTEALCEYYSGQETICDANSTGGKPLPVIKVRLVVECQEKSDEAKDADSRNAEVSYEAKEAKPPSQPQSSRYHERRQIRKTVEIKDLFEAVNAQETKEIKKVSIIGSAGIGKTILTQYITYQWSRNQLWQDRFKYVFCLHLKNLTKYTD